MLYVIGLGLYDEKDITVRGLEVSVQKRLLEILLTAVGILRRPLRSLQEYT